MKCKPLLKGHQRQLQDAYQVQPDENEQDATDLTELELVCPEKTAQCAGRRAQRYKGARKAKYKHDRMQEGDEACRTIILPTCGLRDALSDQLRQEDRDQR